MSKPVQHHYLPQNAYLKFFKSPEKEDSIWMYQRGKETKLVSINNAAKERHLYSFKEKDGKYNTGLESVLAQMEDIASKILTKFNDSSDAVTITLQEKSELAYFLAMQFGRTPAYRKLLKLQAIEMAKLHMQAMASNKEALAHVMKETKKENPEIPDISTEEMQKFILDDSRYTIEMDGKDYFLKQAMNLVEHIYPAFMMKNILIVKSPDVEFITSDHPVSLIPNPAIPPFYSGGFLMSGIFVPIGSHTALFWKNPDGQNIQINKKEDVVTGYIHMSGWQVRGLNRITIKGAERFLFASISNSKIKEIFGKTFPPKRFYMNSPFSRKKN